MYTELLARHVVCFVLCVLFETLITDGKVVNINIVVISENHQTPCQSVEQSATVHRMDGDTVSIDVTWMHTSTTFETLYEASMLFLNNTDIAVINSHKRVIAAVLPLLQQRKIHVVHWPARYIFSNKFPPELTEDRQCGGGLNVNDQFEVECTCDNEFIARTFNNTDENAISQTEVHSKSYIIASMIAQLNTGNLFIIIQIDKEAKLEFDYAALNKFNSQMIVYDESALQTEEQIKKMFLEAMITMQRPNIECLIICNVTCVRNILSKANKMAGQPEYETDIRMLSKWLIFASDDVKKETPRIASKLNNVAFVVTSHSDGGKPCSVDENIFKILKRVLNHLQCSDEDATKKGNTVSRFSEILQMYRTRIEKQILETDISTLLLQPGGRQYKAIDTVKNYLYNSHVTRELFPNIHYGFNGREFSVATIESQPFVFKTQTGHGENVSVTYSGYCIDLLAELANLLNFTYTLTEPEDRQWGMRNPDGNWTGLVGLLQRKEVDLVVASLSKDKRREKVMDFSYPFFYEYVGGIMKKPDPDKEKWKTYFYPFSWEVYIMILILLPVTSLFLCLFEKYNPFYRFENRKNKEGLHRFRDSFWFVLGALLSQGGIHRPASITGRTMVSFFCLFSIIMLALYSGNLIAFLAVSKDNHPFDSLKELLKQNDYTWGTLNGTLWVTMFNESTDPTHKAVWNKMVETAGSDPAVLSGDNDVHLEKVRDGQYMYIGDYTQFENIMRNTSKCDLILMKEKFFPNQFGIGLQKDSPYKDLFSEKVMEISESGLPAMWKQKWWAKSAFCSGTSVAESKKIKLVDIQSAFYLVVMGIAIALLTLIGEKLACNVVLPQTTSRRF